MSTVDFALRHLRAQHRATLLADGTPHRIRTVIDARSRTIVANLHPAALEAEETVLHVPEENPDLGPELEALVALTALDPDRDAGCDRWLAAHGSASERAFAAATIESIRFGGEVIDGEELDLSNPLLGVEGLLLRRLNQQRAALAALVRSRLGVAAVDEVTAIAVDPDGIDVRSARAVLPLRVELPPGWLTVEGAADRVEGLLGGEGPWSS